MKHYLISLSLLLVVAAGCCIHKPLPVRISARDSVAVRYKDSTVIRWVPVEVSVPAESSRAVVPDSSHLETSVAVSDAMIDSSGRLHHSLRNKPVKIPALVPEKEHHIEKMETEIAQEKETVTVYVEKSLSKWQVFWMQLGKIAAGIIGLQILASLWKVFRKFM